MTFTVHRGRISQWAVSKLFHCSNNYPEMGARPTLIGLLRKVKAQIPWSDLDRQTDGWIDGQWITRGFSECVSL